MDITRVLIATGLVLLVLWLYQFWLEYQYPSYYQQGQEVTQQSPQERTEAPKEARKPKTKELPSLQEPAGKSAPSTKGPTDSPAGSTIEVETDVLRVVFSTRGGDPKIASLLPYRTENRQEAPPVTVLKPRGQWQVTGQSGWTRRGDTSLADHRVLYQGPEKDLKMQPDQKRLTVTFQKELKGVLYTKAYHFERGSYKVEVDYTVQNNSPRPWQGYLYGQLRNQGEKEGSFFLYSYNGPVAFANDEMLTFSLADLRENPYQKQSSYGWTGVMDRYFLAAWLPAPDESNTLFVRGQEGQAFAGFWKSFPSLEAGETASASASLYLGPKDQSILKGVGRGLHRAVDYGILSFIALPLFQVLQFFYTWVGNYGVAIILLIIVIKLIFYPLFSMSYRSMAKLRKVQPRLEQAKRDYGDDRAKMGEAMRQIYTEEKVNPLGGCLPILVQIPVFIALYWVLLESVELRHQPFIGWIDDLAAQDPYYVLPVLMGGSMAAQQLMSPSPMDPTQKKVMMALPVALTLFFTQFPAGLVLYWFSNNLLSIAQQWWIMRKTG